MQVTALCFVAMCMLAATALLAAWLAPNQLLLLIGPNYANLQTELPIGMATAAASMLTSFLILTARVRGWVKLDPVFALWQLAAITMLCGVWDFGSTRLILQLNLTIASSALLCAATVFILGLCRPDLVAARLT